MKSGPAEWLRRGLTGSAYFLPIEKWFISVSVGDFKEYETQGNEVKKVGILSILAAGKSAHTEGT